MGDWPTSKLPKSAIRRDETILRLGGDGCGFAMTWTADDRQLVSACDGAGWPENPRDHYFNTRVFEIKGNPQEATFEPLSGYPDLALWDMMDGFGLLDGAAPFYGWNLLAVGKRVYQFLSTNDRPMDLEDRNTWMHSGKTGATLIYSPDNAHTWQGDDVTTPLGRSTRRQIARDERLFFSEAQGAFALPSFLQMGKAYEENRDGYVYVYAPNGSTEGTMNELVLARVPTARVLDRGAYEFFARVERNGDAKWRKDVTARAPVLTFPSGRVPDVFPLAWQPSVVYNPPLGVYMLVTSSGISAWGEAATSLWGAFTPSYMGLWVAAEPWGPWTQILEETAWTPASDLGSRPVQPQIAPKWITEDGRSFWLVWGDWQPLTGYEQSHDKARLHAAHVHDRHEYEWRRLQWRQFHPYYGFNTQRVDLVL